MRSIKYIVLHCTATPQTTTVASIQRYWAVNLKWRNPGYHFIILPDGTIVQLQSISAVANGVMGYNSTSIHISYIGGGGYGKVPAVDNRTAQQIASQIKLLRKLKKMFPEAEIKGHRDFPNVRKDCPSFSPEEFLKGINLDIEPFDNFVIIIN
jgi:N-acetylmuramoyl-L-alanine amidase